MLRKIEVLCEENMQTSDHVLEECNIWSMIFFHLEAIRNGMATVFFFFFLLITRVFDVLVA